MRRIPVLLLLSLCACGTEPQHDDGTCPQTYEFGNHGCAVVRGLVLAADDQPMAGVSVSGLGADDNEGIGFTSMDSRSDGTFELRLIRFLQLSGSEEDSASVWVRAVVRPPPSQNVATVRDEVLTRIRIVPVGQIPETVTVTLRPRSP